MLTYHYHYFSFAEQVGFKPVHTVHNVAGRERTITGQTESAQIYFNEYIHTIRHRQAPASKVRRDVLTCCVRYCLVGCRTQLSMAVRCRSDFFWSMWILEQIVGTLMVCYLPVSLRIPLSGIAADFPFRICSIQVFADCLDCEISSALINECRYNPLQ
jgi:hypothetical protein